MKTKITILILVAMALVSGCKYANPPAIRNGTDAPIRIHFTLNRDQQCDLTLTPGNTVWTSSKDRDTQILELRVNQLRFDLSKIEKQYQAKIMFLVRTEGVIVLHMGDLPHKWYELAPDELADHSTQILKPE